MEQPIALLLIDIQNDYFPGGTMELTGAEGAAEKAGILLDLFRARKLPVIHVQHLAVRPTATFFLPETLGAEIRERVKPLPGEPLIVKHFPNSFRSTGLLDLLKDCGVKQLVICGMMTHMCVDATTRAAKDFGFDCWLIADACATKDLEINGVTVSAAEVQTSFLAALNYFYSTVTTTREFIQEISPNLL